MRVVQMNASSPQKTFRQPPSAATVQKKNAFSLNVKSFKTDDWILLGIIAALILEGSDDYILLASLGYLFIMGLQNS